MLSTDEDEKNYAIACDSDLAIAAKSFSPFRFRRMVLEELPFQIRNVGAFTFHLKKDLDSTSSEFFIRASKALSSTASTMQLLS